MSVSALLHLIKSAQAEDRQERVAGGLAGQGPPCIDLTTLNSDDTAGRVRHLCAKARMPLKPELQAALGLADGHAMA